MGFRIPDSTIHNFPDSVIRIAEALNKAVRSYIKLCFNLPCYFAGSCFSHACHHGGMCRARRHGFYCECLPGFMGTRCEGLFRISFSSQCVFSFTIITIARFVVEESVELGVMGSIVSVYWVLWAQDAKVCFVFLFQVSAYFRSR